MSEPGAIFAAWGIVAIGILWLGVLFGFTGDTPRQRRNGARMILTCWAWPVWVIAFAIYGVGWVLVALWKAADFNH